MYSEMQKPPGKDSHSQVMYTPKPYYDDSCDCKLKFCISPWAILRWLQVAVGIVVVGCVSTTCNSTGCVNVTNQFGRVAFGQAYVLLAGGCAIIITLLFIMFYSMNLHRASPGIILVLERVFTVLIILAYIPLAATECYYAHKASYDPELQGLGRPNIGMRPQWIIAAVFAFINLALYMVDMIGQCTSHYPSGLTNV